MAMLRPLGCALEVALALLASHPDLSALVVHAVADYVRGDGHQQFVIIYLFRPFAGQHV